MTSRQSGHQRLAEKAVASTNFSRSSRSGADRSSVMRNRSCSQVTVCQGTQRSPSAGPRRNAFIRSPQDATSSGPCDASAAASAASNAAKPPPGATIVPYCHRSWQRKNWTMCATSAGATRSSFGDLGGDAAAGFARFAGDGAFAAGDGAFAAGFRLGARRFFGAGASGSESSSKSRRAALPSFAKPLSTSLRRSARVPPRSRNCCTVVADLYFS
mmetsp:Transcript_29546/g.100443  ORF Transcript_29546/g.100443 Transcript_29546/m.100443 type:complete len:215 (-) Transcript_29546:283-927(-)